MQYFVSLKVLWNKNDLNSFENYKVKPSTQEPLHSMADEVNQNDFLYWNQVIAVKRS